MGIVITAIAGLTRAPGQDRDDPLHLSTRTIGGRGLYHARAVLIALLLGIPAIFPQAQPLTDARSCGPSSEDMRAPLALPSLAPLVKKVGAAVVTVTKRQSVSLHQEEPLFESARRSESAYAPPREFLLRSLGSGFIVSTDGYVLTNAHVVTDAAEVVVQLIDKRELRATVVGVDLWSDIALIKVDAKDLPHLAIGDSQALEVGDWVLAIGAPFGFVNSVTQGIVAAKGRTVPGGRYLPFIQTDVPINPGHSGGPLLNLRGEVVGMNSMIYSETGSYVGLSFALPIDFVVQIAETLRASGEVRRGRLGIEFQEVSDTLAEAFGLHKPQGALINAVQPGGPAEQAGIEPGDVVLKLDGQAVEDGADLARAAIGKTPGTTVALEVWRRGRKLLLNARLAEFAPDDGGSTRHLANGIPSYRLGLTLRVISEAERREIQAQGTIVVRKAEGLAAKIGLREGDIVLRVNSQRVTNLEEFQGALARSDRTVALLIERGGVSLFVALPIGAGAADLRTR